MPSPSQAADQAEQERRALQFGFEGTLARELVDMDIVRAQADPVRPVPHGLTQHLYASSCCVKSTMQRHNGMLSSGLCSCRDHAARETSTASTALWYQKRDCCDAAHAKLSLCSCQQLHVAGCGRGNPCKSAGDPRRVYALHLTGSGRPAAAGAGGVHAAAGGACSGARRRRRL